MSKSESAGKIDSRSAEKKVRISENITAKKDAQTSKDSARPEAQEIYDEGPFLYEPIKTGKATVPKKATPAPAYGGVWYGKFAGNLPRTEKARQVTGAQQAYVIVPPSQTSYMSPSIVTLAKSDTDLSRGPIYPVTTVGGAIDQPNDVLDKARRKTNTLLIVVIGVVIASVLLMLGLGIVIYFTTIRHSSAKDNIITAHSLCQATYGKCSIFVDKNLAPYPKNCTQKIPCYSRCYYPTTTLDKFAHKYKISATPSYVSGKNGLICGERSTCRDGICKETATYAYNYDIDSKSMIDCINITYKSEFGCINTDMCHNESIYCQTRDQIRLGFKIADFKEDFIYSIDTIRCGTPCGKGGRLPNISDWLQKKGCKYVQPGSCMYACKDDDLHILRLPPGTPCTHTRKGYCWEGRCYESERFHTSAIQPQPLARGCYGSIRGARCYREGSSVDCVHNHRVDRLGRAQTRYGRNCVQWNRADIPKKYHGYGSTGCILHDKKIPWCYSISKNVVWNYCYDFCPSRNIYSKDKGLIRVVVMYYSQYAEMEFAKQGAKHIKQLKADIVIILWPSGPDSDQLMEDLIDSLNSHISIPSQKWKSCGADNRKMTRVVIKGPLNVTKGKIRAPSGTIACDVTAKEGRSFEVVATNGPHINYPASLPDSCDCPNSIFKCMRKRDIEKAEMDRYNHMIRVLSGVKGKNDVLVVGAFGQPSHLDWTGKASHIHCDDTYEWSISQSMYSAGFADSYRTIHPDPSLWPGNTWSTLPSNGRTPQGRYAFQYYKGHSIKPTRAFTYPKSEPSKLLKARWPSNQYAVVVDYEFK